jgi:DNA helicase II / ATP-dependent DNA helicase PcrA
MSGAAEIRLSIQQAEVVAHLNGPLLVVAGPGSGKTRVLTERVRTLLTSVPGHFRVLALTFTNKAADAMRERLVDLGDERHRAFIGTIHGFCMEVLAERGSVVGVDGALNIFEQFKDRKDILLRAIDEDPLLSDELSSEIDAKARGRRVDSWLRAISHIKAHPITCAIIEDDLDRRVVEAYDAGLRACNAYDFDDLLLLTYRLFNENPNMADFFRRLYKFICIDEAQDLNEAQYAVLCALCGDSFKNVMMVGDPKQSIYGFSTSSPEYMTRFREEFGAKVVNLTDNYRSSQEVVSVARSLDQKYLVDAQLPVQGRASALVGKDEEDEAKLIVDELQRLFAEGHPDVEGGIDPSKCAILGRTRFALLAIEKEVRSRGIPFYKRLSSNHENESDVVDDFQLALRIVANPRDRLHFAAIAKKWKVSHGGSAREPLAELARMAQSAPPAAKTVVEAVVVATKNPSKLDLMPAFEVLKRYADSVDDNDRRAIYEDIAVFSQEWDQYLRSDGPRTIASFMSSKALGATQKADRGGLALLTVHSSKGLEFDVVVVAGMAEGTFPDYRAAGGTELAEEGRLAFVAVTRSKRLLYLSYPKTKLMPWGDRKVQSSSRFLRAASLT